MELAYASILGIDMLLKNMSITAPKGYSSGYSLKKIERDMGRPRIPETKVPTVDIGM